VPPRRLVSDERARLLEVLSGMRVPAGRIAPVLDRGWLLRNLAVHNADHPDFDEAVRLLKML